jgi:hypothetical protein
MSTNLTLEPQANTGKTNLRWSFKEFRQVKRTRTWWILAGLIIVGLATWAVLTGNFLFALILLIGSVIFINESRRQPRRLECQITTLGVVVGKKFWRWSELTSFWIAYHPPETANLYVVPKNPLDPRVTILLNQTNPVTVRDLLTKYIIEDLTREDIPTSEALSRLLKLQ